MWSSCCQNEHTGAGKSIRLRYHHDILLSTTNDVDTRACKSDKWLTTLYVCDTCTLLKFRIEHWCKCNAIVKSQYIKTGIHGNEQDSQKILRSFTNHTFRPEFCVDLPLASKIGNTPITTQYECFTGKHNNWSYNWKTWSHYANIGTVECDTMQFEQFCFFSDLIRTTGTLPGENSIKINPKAIGVISLSVSSASIVEAANHWNAKRMESNGYITPVEEPPLWLSSMVVSLRNNKVIIPNDPNEFYEAIKRKHHPMKR